MVGHTANLYLIGCIYGEIWEFIPHRVQGLKKVSQKNDTSSRKRKNRRIFDLQTNHKTMNHETKTKLKAALATGYIVLTACLGLAFFGRFILAIITN